MNKLGRLRIKAGSVVRGVVRRLSRTSLGRLVTDPAVQVARERTVEVTHGSISLVLSVPSGLNRFRAATFSTKEPETLEWIDGFRTDSVLWDIGANVGLYSCYAAARGCRVVAFEPSVFNLEMLARNVHLNTLSDAVTIVPLPLTDSPGPEKLRMSTTEWGGAQSSFGVDYGFDGQELEIVLEYSMVGTSMDEAPAALAIATPDHVKIDVDGIEHLVLEGGSSILSQVESVLVEVDDRFALQGERTGIALVGAGLEFVEKKRSSLFDDGPYASCFNQIWVRR